MEFTPISQKKEIDLSILQRKPMLDSTTILEIQPLAPLSMVSELPGSYYKTLKVPDKKMLCGLFENILGWHIDIADRKQIIEELTRLRKKQAKEESSSKLLSQTKGSTYIPLLMDYFEINLQYIPEAIFYDDLWSKAYRRADAIVHPKGTFNISYNLIAQKRELQRNDKNPKQVDDKALEAFFKSNLEQFPLYYSTPTVREYLFTKGKYEIKITIDSELYEMLRENLLFENIGYLGNSEGWVDLNFKKL
ncbi:hypothetical protein EZS27_028227 [termite gut metagenome]|uniref:Type I-PGING CRISPR-associated protein Cas5p n=1 Tax=termite gut metagenome TaxID=433724 RepID=A0A5J4QMK1_9ZZZZ